jgi:hypothetical protein
MATATASVASSRPETVTWAVILTVVPTLLSFPALLLPGADEIPAAAIVIGVILAVVTFIGAWGLWNCRKWGAIAVAIPTALNVLTSLPGLVGANSGWILASIIVMTPPAIAALVLIVHPNSRAAYR